MAEEPSFAVTAQMLPRARAFILSGHSDGAIREAAAPMVTLTAADCTHTIHRAWLVPAANDFRVRRADQPAVTITGNADRMRAFLVDGQNARTAAKGGVDVRAADAPAMTVAASGKGTYRAWLVQDQQNVPRPRTAPAHTVTAGSNHLVRAWLSQGRVVKMTQRALARFQSVPDWYALPDRASLACQIIGNGVAVTVAQRIGEGLIALAHEAAA